MASCVWARAVAYGVSVLHCGEKVGIRVLRHVGKSSVSVASVSRVAVILMQRGNVLLRAEGVGSV